MRIRITPLWMIIGLMVLIGTTAPVCGAYDLFGGFIPQGTPQIDGRITSGEWQDSGHRRLFKFFGEDARVDVYLMWDASYLYLAADVADYELWVDSYTEAEPWRSTWDDDAFKWEIDPNFSRDEYFQAEDRVLAVNATGTAVRFDRGDGAGGTAGIWVDPASNGLKTAATYSGTLNDYTYQNLTAASQRDEGFVVEMAISWDQLMEGGGFSPYDGYAMGMNLTHIEDDTGGALDPDYYKQWKRVADEITRFMGEEGYPEHWAQFVLSAAGDTTPPGAVSGLTAAHTRAFATRLHFTATGDNGATGRAAAYEIRYSTAPVTAENWADATVYRNSFRPAASGSTETLTLIGLSPNTAYHIGVKAVDERGNSGALSTVTVTTGGADGDSDKGYLTVDPGRRYLAWENGEPLIVIGDNQGMSWPHIRTFYDGEMWNDDLGRYENFQEYDTGGISNGRAYLKYLSDHGVNTIRIMAEDLEPTHPVYLYSDVSGGPDSIVFNQDTLDFLTTFLDECAAVGINVIIVPFDTFYYSSALSGWSKVPLSTAMGGPMATSEGFFAPENRAYIQAILKKLVDTVGDRRNLLAWDMVNEFDSDEPEIGWNRASYASREATLNDLADYLKQIDPYHMVYVSSVRWDPKFTRHLPETADTAIMGNAPALILNNGRFDFNSTHMYYHDIRDPNYNDPANPASIYTAAANDRDKTIAPAARVAQGMQFYTAYALDPKPYLCTEHGPIQFYTQAFDSYYTEADDNQIFHNTLWAFLASGEAGSGLRWPGQALSDHKLTDQMRNYQLAVKQFVDHGEIDFAGFSPVQIGPEMTLTGTGAPVVRTGITDGRQGIVFLVNDERKQANGTISGASLQIGNLWPGGRFRFGFWDTDDPAKTGPVSTVAVTADSAGTASVPLPDFDKTLAMQFSCTACESGGDQPATGALVTDDLWIRAVINTVDKGAIEGQWQLGGKDTTARGDQVIWGYFYASPSDVSWGNADNPDLFVKIWIDVNGPVYVDFFHVSVPDIDVYTDFGYSGAPRPDQSHTATLTTRFVEHRLINGVSGFNLQAEDGIPPAGYTQSGNPVGTLLANNLRIGAMINTVDKGPIEGVWRLGGQDVTARGDTVVWGYFYADPATVSWGSADNPDLFIKIWYDVTGAIFVDYFHVSVPDIEAYADFPNDGSYDDSGTAILSNRFVEFRYQR